MNRFPRFVLVALFLMLASCSRRVAHGSIDSHAVMRTLLQPAGRVTRIFSVDIGQFDATASSKDWDEFRSQAASPEYIVGTSSLANVRPWIGHPDCRTCSARSQRITFNGLTRNGVYQLNVYPSYINGKPTYTATAIGGQILTGSTNTFPATGYLFAADEQYHGGDYAWHIAFRATSPSVTLTLRAQDESGANYLYFDYFDTTIPRDFSYLVDWVKQMDQAHNAGNWFKNDLWLADGRYTWQEYIALEGYLHMYELTRDTYWLFKLVDHADALLSWRDFLRGRVGWDGTASPAWMELSTGYVCLGWAGIHLRDLMRFAALVATTPSLKNVAVPGQPGQTLFSKASTYAAAFRNAFNYFQPLWRSQGGLGWYVFPASLPPRYASLENQPQAFDYTSSLSSASLWASRYYTAVGDAGFAAQLRSQVTAYANYMKQTELMVVGGAVYMWYFSTYYAPQYQDFGHSNADVRFFQEMRDAGLVFDDADMRLFANSLAGFIDGRFSVPFNQVNYGTVSGVIGAELSEWHRFLAYQPGLTYIGLEYIKRNHYPFWDVVNAAHTLDRE